jgi:hypothetical protein
MLRQKTVGVLAIVFTIIYLFFPACRAAPIDIFGLPHTALGNATLEVNGRSLVVTNIGSGGGDGVLVGLPPGTTKWEALFNSLEPQSYAQSSFFQITSIGTINGVPNQIIATARATDIGSAWAVTFDFSRISSGPLLVNYFLGDMLVGSETIPNPSEAVWLMPNVSWGGPDGPDPDCPKPCLDTVEITAKGPGKIISPFGTFFADSFDVGSLSEDPGFLSASSLTASGIPSFTINAELLVVTPAAVPEPSSLILISFGVAGVAFGRRRWWRKAATA